MRNLIISFPEHYYGTYVVEELIESINVLITNIEGDIYTEEISMVFELNNSLQAVLIKSLKNQKEITGKGTLLVLNLPLSQISELKKQLITILQIADGSLMLQQFRRVIDLINDIDIFF